MAAGPATTPQIPQSKSTSKGAKKKKSPRPEEPEGPAAAAAAAPASVSTPEIDMPNGSVEGGNGDGSESPYLKDLYKNIRNINKKIANASKLDGVLAENPGKTLDELVLARKINADQKAQILKRPALQGLVVQLEDQIAQFKKLDDDFRAKMQAERAALEQAYEARLAQELEDKVAAAQEDVRTRMQEEHQADLLLVSQFLQLAAVRRGDETADPELEENKALEGLLAKVYGGDQSAVTTMLKIAEGAEEGTVSVEGQPLAVTFAQVKAIALALPRPAMSTLSEEVPESGPTELPVQSDPTLVNAGMTELDAPTTVAMAMASGHDEPTYELNAPQNSGFGEGAANMAAETSWDNDKTKDDLSGSQEWVEVPRDTAETDTGLTATLGAQPNTQSWADETPEASEVKTASPPNQNDGFHEVHRNRGGRHHGDGHFRGRGRGGGDGYRGRGGYRGDGMRGRGHRGGGGPRGGARGGRRPEES